MAIAREVENCPNCGKPLKSRHKNMGNDFVGDTLWCMRDWIAGYEYRKATSSPPEPSSKEQENDAVGFADWMDEKQKSRQLVRLKDNKIKWFYNHKPEAKEGKQQWIHYTTEQLYQLYKSNHEK